MFNLFKAKKQDSSTETKVLTKDDAARSSKAKKQSFEIKANFGGLNGWPTDAAVVTYFPLQGLLCTSTESGALLVYGKKFQFYRPRSGNETGCVKHIASVGNDICLVVYDDNSIAVFRLPTLEILDTASKNWITNSDDYPGMELSCLHVDAYAEKSQRAFVYIGTSLGDVHVLEISTTTGSIRICDYIISCRDVDIATPMGVTAIISDEKCVMIGYDAVYSRQEDGDRDSDADSQTSPSSPKNDHTQRFSSFIGEMPSPAASSRCLGAIVVFNISKRRVRHSYTAASGVNFLVMDATGDTLYAVLHSGEILSLTACSGKSLSLTVWRLSQSDDDDYYDEDAAQSVKQIKWLPPQTPTNSNAAGCYFLLMHDDSIVCLSPSGQQGKMTEITKIRPLEDEEIFDFHIVPIAQTKSVSEKKRDSFSNTSPHANAGLLLVTKKIPCGEMLKKQRSENVSNLSVNTGRNRINSGSLKASRGMQLRVLRCPTGISTIPTAVKGATAIEVAVAIAVAITESSPPPSVGKERNDHGPREQSIGLPFPKENSWTCVNALPPCGSETSMASVLLSSSSGSQKAVGESKRSEELSPRIHALSQTRKRSLFVNEDNGTEVVLAEKEGNIKREMNSAVDLVFLGQKNGILSIWASSPSEGSDTDSKGYYAAWRQLRSFECISDEDEGKSSKECSPSTSPFKNSMSLFFPSNSMASLGTGNAWVTAITPDEGAGLFAAGTSDGDLTVWEVYQADTAMSCVEHTARLNAGRVTDAHMSDGSKSSGRSVNGGEQSPSPELRNLVFSWDEDSDDDDQDDDEDDDEDVVEDKAVVYDARKLNLSALSFKDQLFKQNRRQSRSDRERKRKSSATSPTSPELPKSKADLKLSLASITNNDYKDPEEYARNHAPFVPDDIRVAFRAKVPGAVTAQLLLSDCLIFVVGTSAGGVWISRGLGDKSLVQIDLGGLWKASTKCPGSSNNSEIAVTALFYSLYSGASDYNSGRDTLSPIPVVYAIFACGNIAVVCLQTCTMVAYCLTEESTEVSGLGSILKKRTMAKKELGKGTDFQRDDRFNEFESDAEGDGPEGSGLVSVATCTVTDAANNDIARPLHKATYSVKSVFQNGKQVISISFISLSCPVDSSSSESSTKCNTARGESENQDRIDVRLRSRSNSDVYSTSSSSKGTLSDEQLGNPRYLLVVVGTNLITYDITKFCKLSVQLGRPKRSYSVTGYNSDSNDPTPEASYTTVKGGVQSSQVVSNSQFIAGKKYAYSDKSLNSAPTSCITLVNAYGKMPTISVKEKTLLCDDDLFLRCGGSKRSSSRIESNNMKKECISGENSNDRSIRVPFNAALKAGVLLSNGSSYLLQKNGLILSYSFNDANTHEVSATLPSRISKKISALAPSMTLYPCPEHDVKIQNYQNFFRGKQGSLFGVITTVHSGPADFVKLFLKSRDKSYKREKTKIVKKYERMEKPVEKPQTSSQSSINYNKEENERNSDKEKMDRDCDSCSGSPGKSNKLSLFSSSVIKEKSTTASSKQNAESVQSNMSEALRNLEERGEKLNRMNAQAEEMSEGAQHFRDLVKLHKQELQKKATRWGL